jgi:hypothetical protein
VLSRLASRAFAADDRRKVQGNPAYTWRFSISGVTLQGTLQGNACCRLTSHIMVPTARHREA